MLLSHKHADADMQHKLNMQQHQGSVVGMNINTRSQTKILRIITNPIAISDTPHEDVNEYVT